MVRLSGKADASPRGERRNNPSANVAGKDKSDGEKIPVPK